MYQLLLRAIALVAATLVTSAAAQADPVQPPTSVSFDQLAAEAWIAIPDPDVSHQIIIPVMLNGHVEQALLDTSSANATIDSRRARQLGLKPRPWGDAKTSGGAARFEIAAIESIDVGGLHQRGGDIFLSDLSALAALSPRPFTMTIGSHLLTQFAVDIDFDTARLRFRRTGSRWAVGTDVPLTINPSGNGFITEIGIDGQRVVDAVLNTGANNTLTIDGDLARQVLSDQPVSDLMSFVYSGRSASRLFHARSVMLGSAKLAGVATGISADEVLPDEAGPPSRAIIGLALLQRFNVTLDAAAGRMTLAPRLRAPPSDPISTSGIQGFYQADGLAVVHVMRGSPAAAAGVKDGDRICRIDGATVNARSSPAQRGWSTGTPGRRIVLTLCDGRSLPIVLARFY